MDMPGHVKTKQVVDQPLKAADARTGWLCRFAEMGVAKDAGLLEHKAAPLEWRKAQATRRAAVAPSAAMAKAGHAGRQGPASTEVGRLILPQAGRTELQPTGLHLRLSGSLRQGAQRQSQGRKGNGVK